MTSPCRMHDNQPELLPLPEPAGTIFDDGYWLQNKNGPLAKLMPHISRQNDFFTAEQMRQYAESVRRAERDAVIEALRGIDQTEIESPHGWWETSTGAKFGADVLQKVKNILGIQEKP